MDTMVGLVGVISTALDPLGELPLAGGSILRIILRTVSEMRDYCE